VMISVVTVAGAGGKIIVIGGRLAVRVARNVYEWL
jgi:hypothetical protein